MTYIRFLAVAGSMAAVCVFAQPADAGGGSWGSSGGSYGGAAYVGGSCGGSCGGWASRQRARRAGSYSNGGSRGGSSGGSWGGSSGGSSGGSYGSSGGRRVGLFARMRARKAARRSTRRSYGSSGGSYGGSSGGSSGGQVMVSNHSGGSSGGGSRGTAYSSYSARSNSAPVYSAPIVSSVSVGAAAPYESAAVSPVYSAGSPVYSAGSSVIAQPVMEQPVIGQSTDSVTVPSGTIHGETILDSTPHASAKPAVQSDSAILTVSVPENAKVTVNEHPTTSDGSVRQFMSKGLKEGYVYTYVVKVIYDQDGEEKSDSQKVKLRAGETKDVVFDVADQETDDVEAADDNRDETARAPLPTDENVVTVVRLHVPADAKVTLAGNPTNGNGVIRTFRTKQLKAGQHWKNYTVRVVSDVNGQSISQERTIDVTSGSTNELKFNFHTVDSVAKH
jgi:uncharacterized protein (TIGR03000 family)